MANTTCAGSGLRGRALPVISFTAQEHGGKQENFEQSCEANETMKNWTLAAALLLGCTVGDGVWAKGTIRLNNSEARAGLFFGSGDSPAAAGTMVMILGGTNLSSLAPVRSELPGGPTIFTATDVNRFGPGTGTFFNAYYGGVPGVPDGGSAFIELLAWYGAADFDTARTTTNAWWYSVRWTQNVGYGGWQALPVALEIPVPMHMQPGGVPEPSSLRLAVLGLLCLTVCSRLNLCRNKCLSGRRP